MLVKDGMPELDATKVTSQDIENNPSLAIGVLLDSLWWRAVEIHHSNGFTKQQLKGVFKLLHEWVYARGPLTIEAALKLAEQKSTKWEQNMILMWAGKRGRPIKLRHAAIEALFLKEYLNKRWLEVTRRVCPCGKSHVGPDGTNYAKANCQRNLETVVRILKKLLRADKIDFPPKPPAKDHRLKAPFLPAIRVQNDTSTPDAAAPKPRPPWVVELHQRHWAIELLLDQREPMPIIPTNDYPEGVDVDEALGMFVPWSPGWVPMWFPDIMLLNRGTGQIQIERPNPQQRLDWFDKALPHFAKSVWPPEGSLSLKKREIAVALLLMYHAAQLEEIPAPDEMSPGN